MRIALEHVSYVYRNSGTQQTTALHDVSLSLTQGERVAVIGHGGSGKSTLSLLLAGLYRPTGGQLTIEDDGDPSRASFRRVGIAFQYPEHQLFGETVMEEVAFGAKNFGVPQEELPQRVRAALEEVGLDAEQVLERSPFHLSGGQKRRVCLASVLVTDPDCIILDEPSAGLDEKGRRWVADMVHRLHSKGKTVVWVTHDMEEAAEYAERIIVLSGGRVIADGTPQQVFAAEEVLQQAHLALPPAAQLVRTLHQRGAALPGQAVTVEEACAELLTWLQNGAKKGGGSPV